MNKELNLMGLAKRAGKIIPGTDNVCEGMAKRKIYLVYISLSASDLTKDKMDKKCFFYHVPVVVEYNTEQLDKALGMHNSKVIGIADQGFAKALLSLRTNQKVNIENK